MSQHATVYITQNFENNLDSIEQFFTDNEAPEQFDALIEDLFGTIIPNLQRFPLLGKNFLEHQPGSIEGVNLTESIQRYLNGKGEVREYITGDYLILYALIAGIIYLLSIKHHKQLAFDFISTWIDN
ncbi:MAG: type II toxin-antitoxin system RelE/ParE family toxin [Gammaproteobacteria bacterium]|nr:type II toxin-antitoxin system RelE/ParE family toxin [Gammaproteobacteria bacterium]